MGIEDFPEGLGLRTQEKNGNLLVEILDQRLLPQEETWISVESVDQAVEIIHRLSVRGAPLIGAMASVTLAMASLNQLKTKFAILESAEKLRKARPTAVNLMWAMDRMVKLVEQDDSSPGITLELDHPLRKDLLKEASHILKEDQLMCDRMAEWGASLIEDGDGILTHCNTGGLATMGVGTALGVIRRAHEAGKNIHVYVDETRPLLQGGRLTTWECEKLGIPYTLISDSMAGVLMARGKIQRVFVGSDRIARNGDIANKIGTYGLAVLSEYHGIPFWPVAPLSTVDFQCESGEAIPVEQRAPDEVRGASGSFGRVIWSPEKAPTWNPSFDVTPVKLITGLVLDRGIITREELQLGALSDLSKVGI